MARKLGLIMKQSGYPKNSHFARGMMGLYFTEDEVEAILPNYDYGHAMAYLWRRFGPPVNGCDPYKELVCYNLTTRAKGVYLSCNCYLHVSCCFGFGLSHELYEKVMEWTMRERRKRHSRGRDNWPSWLKDIWAALLEAIADLKKPVGVRDWYITIEGEFKDCPKQEVQPSRKAGYGVIDAYYKRFEEKSK